MSSTTYQTGWIQQLKRFVKQPIFASPRIGKDEVKAFAAESAQKVIAVGANNFQPWVGTQVALENGQKRVVVVDGGQA